MRQIYYTIKTLLRGRSSTVTKLISLTLGLLVGILLFSQIAYELSYEKCYPDPERLVLVRALITNQKTGEVMGDDGNNYDETVFAPLAAAMAEDMPEWIENATVVYTFSELPVYKDNKLLDAHYISADTCFFRTMGIEVLKGNRQDFAIPGSIFISQSFARKTFGDEDPIGKTLSLDKQHDITVRGIYHDMPENSMLKHDFVLSIHQNGGYLGGGNWNSNDVYYAFLRLRKASDLEAVNGNIQRMVEKHTAAEWDGWKEDFSVIPLADRHLDNPNTQKRLVILGFLGFAIFFVSIMNYILVTIATLSRRAKSVGVHKCSGASSGDVFSMFLIETGIVVLVATLLTTLLIYVFHESIEELLAVRLLSLFSWETLWVPLSIVVILFLIAGVLPGRIFSRIPVTQIFRRYTEGKKGWKRSLLFVQFTGVSFVMGLLIVTLLQYSMLMNRDMGIRTPGLVEAESWLEKETVESVKDYIRRQPMVEGVSVATNSVLGEYWTRGLMGNDGKRIATMNFNNCTRDYPEVMGIQIIEGGPMKQDGDILVNEELVRRMKWTDGAVGKHLNDIKSNPIVGVFKDVRNKGFYEEQAAIMLYADENANHTFDVRLKAPYDENLKKLNAFVEETFPTIALRFVSVDSKVKDMYSEVYRFRNAVYFTSIFIVLIVMMGLIGYVNDETQRRSKEIAVRKVNGAEVSDVLALLIRGILYVALPAVLIGTAASYYTGTMWLKQFVEQIDMNPLLFIGSALAVLLLIVWVVVLKAWRIANENPVKSIKSE